MTTQEILPRFQSVRQVAGGWSARCPAHDDDRASLSISAGDDGRTLIHCHAGCPLDSILREAGLSNRDLFASANGNGRAPTTRREVAAYNYCDEQGNLLFQVVRFDPKDFRQRAPKDGGGWDWRLGDTRRVLYRLSELLADPTETVYIAEGEKDADRLRGSGLIATTCPGGAGKWRAEYNSHFADRRVVVLPDNDAAGRKHAEQVAAALHGVAASVKVVELPGLAEKQDISNWLDTGHTVGELQSLVEAAPSWKPSPTPTIARESKDPGRVKILADAICVHGHFAQDAGGKLYVYQDGVFRPRADQHIRSRVKALLTEWGQIKQWSTRLASEVIEFIRVDSPELPSRPRVDLVNVENGIVRVADGALLPHDAKYLSAVQLPVKYDPAATCPHIDAFVVGTFPDDAHDLAWEIPGVLMVPATWLQKAILLLGEGCNGKSVWLSLLVRFLGRQNIAAIPLHRLESDKFAAARIVGKLANVCADLPSEHLTGTSTFKALVGGDVLTAEYKFRDSFDVEPFARLVLSANHPPRSPDSSSAFFRRWIVIPFDRVFGPDEQIPRDVLDAQLQAPSELSGLLNRAIEGLRRVQWQRRFSEPASVQAAWLDFHATTDPLAVWLERTTVDDPDTYVPCKALRVAYNAAAEREGRSTMTDTAFGRAVRKLRPAVDYKQRTVGGRLQWCYIGLGLTVYDSAVHTVH